MYMYNSVNYIPCSIHNLKSCWDPVCVRLVWHACVTHYEKHSLVSGPIGILGCESDTRHLSHLIP